VFPELEPTAADTINRWRTLRKLKKQLNPLEYAYVKDLSHDGLRLYVVHRLDGLDHKNALYNAQRRIT